MDSTFLHGCFAARAVFTTTVLTLSLMYTGCSNPVSSTDDSGIQNQTYDNAVNPIDQSAVPDIPPASADALSTLPQIDAGPRQYTDTNVLVTLSGTVDLSEDAETASAYWVQVDGPPAFIVEPTALETAVVIPDLSDVALLRFWLVATDQADRTNAASTIVVVTPQPAFARVAGAVVDPQTGLATFKVRLSNPVPEPVIINYQTVEGTALENLDYLPQTGEITFAANETEREVPVELLQNPSRTGARNFSLRITSNLGEESFFNSGVMVIASTPQEGIGTDLRFSEPGPIVLVAGETFFNPFEDDWTEAQAADVRYFSSDNEIATVDAQGVVSAQAAGTATINAVVPANNQHDELTAAYIVQVEPLDAIQQQISFTQPGPIEIRMDETASNPISIDSDAAPGTGPITYNTANPDIARVDNEGNVEPVAAGETVITATKAADDRYGAATASYTLRVSLLPQTVTVTEPLIEIAVGQSATNPITATDDAVGSGALTWTSSDPSIAQVDAGGTLNGVAPGEALITVERAADNRYATSRTTFEVVVSPAELQGQSIGFTVPGTVDVLITDTVDNPLAEIGSGSGSIRFESSNPDIATVDDEGRVELLSPGVVTISAEKAGDDIYLPATASYELRVSLVPQNLIFEEESLQLEVGTTASNPLFQQSLPPGSGALSYLSSDPEVASIEADGTVTGLATGTATITVNKAADSVYAATSNTYGVEVIEKELLTQTLEFENPGPLETSVDETIVNPVIIGPNNGTGKVTYASSNENVATAAEDGSLTLMSEGTTTITATIAPDDQYAGATASYSLRVSLLPQTLSVKESVVEIEVGQSATNPVATTDDGSGALTWTSSDPGIVQVDSEGTMTGAAQGRAVVTIERAADNRYAATRTSFEVVVSPAELLEQSIRFTMSGPIETLITATLNNPLSETGSGNGSIRFESSNPEVATVDDEGLVEFQAPGTVTISASKAGDDTYLPATASYELRISLVPQNLIFEQETLQVEVGATATNPLDQQSLPPGNGALDYVSSDPAVAIVNADGEVTGQAEGTATISVNKAADGIYSAANSTYTVEVTKKALLTQTLKFESTGPLKAFIDETISNPVKIGPNNGTGKVTYASSDENVATVAEDGSLTLLTAGNTTITAAIAADDQYAGATASYELTVSLLDRPIEFPVSLIYLTVGQTVKVPLQRVEDYFDNRKISFSSSNESIATVGTTAQAGIVQGSETSAPLRPISIDEINVRQPAIDPDLLPIDTNTVTHAFLHGVAPGGPVTITATAEANDTLAASSASIQVIVTDPDNDGQILSEGDAVIRGTWTWDLDWGRETNGADLWWEQQDDTIRRLVPLDGARFVVLGFQDFDAITLQQLKQLKYSSNSINGSNTSDNQLPAGTVIAAITNQGNYCKILIEDYGYDLKIRWVTYGEVILI